MSRNRVLMIVGLLRRRPVALTACGVNSIPTAEENAKAKWADVQAAYPAPRQPHPQPGRDGARRGRVRGARS